MRELLAWSPEVAILLACIVVFALDAFRPSAQRTMRALAFGSMLLAAGLALFVAANASTLYGNYFAATMRVDAMTTYARLLFALAGGLVMLASWNLQSGDDTAGFFGLLLLSLLGEIVVVSGQSLLMLFLGIELLALPSYAMMAIRQRQRRAIRAALKYFILGMFASVVMLYGMALLYGSLGTVSYAGSLFPDPATLSAAKLGVSMLAFFMLMVGLGFKVTAFPFHFWAPDVYADGSTPVVAYVSTLPKVAVMLALYRILGPHFVVDYPLARNLLALLSIGSMVYGNIVALLQDDVRRMLAYSGVANTGYMLVAFVAGGRDAGSGLLFFLVVYVLANLGGFFVVMALGPHKPVSMADFAGLARRSPIMASAMALCMFSLAGTPPLAGFFGKFALFKAAVDNGLVTLALVGLLTTVVSLGYYLRIASSMYGDLIFGTAAPAPEPLAVQRPLRAAVIVVAASTVLLGLAGIPWLATVL